MMFSNFIYFLVALLLYSTCDYPGSNATMPDNGLIIALILMGGFWSLCRFFFLRLKKQEDHITGPDISMDKLIARFSMGALCLFAVNLYLLHLNLLLDDLKIFQLFPTLEALIFLGVFLIYLLIVWSCAWPVQKRYFPGTVSQKEFVRSNISFSLPALLPWFLISLLADLIELLPFEQPRAFLATPLGEIVYVVIFMLAIAGWGPFLIQRVWGCRSLEPGPARLRIEKLCHRAGVKYRDILKWDLFGGSMITAGVMGIWGRFRYILVTPSLISLFTTDEMDAVVAHEIGHVEKHHIHFYLLFFVGYIVCVYAFLDPLVMLIVSGPVLDFVAGGAISQETMMTLVLSTVLIILFLVYFRYGFGFYMRNFERQADLHVYQYLPHARSMITSFHKIAAHSRQAWDKPNWHHFSIKERVHFLARCEANPSFISRHHKKVRGMMWGYIAFLALVCVMGYQLNFGPGKVGMDRYVTGKLILRELKQRGNDPEVQLLAGDYYYDAGDFDKAKIFYQMVIHADPDNAHALNNLAWLYATCSDSSYRNPREALILAQKAVEVDRSAHVMDTFAEALFVNGHYKEALAVARKALAIAQDRKAYYRDQMERFKRYASGNSVPVSI